MDTNLSQELNLRKEKVLDLKKKLNIIDQRAQVVLCLDYSGSMGPLYFGGEVQKLVERVLPLGLAFDDNGEVDFYLFENSYRKLEENVTMQNVYGYIQKNVIANNYSMGGTEYSPVIKAVTEEFSNKKQSGGFMGIGGKTTYQQMDLPVYVIFITDGENSDHMETEYAIKEASNAGIFFQFVGIGGASFNFLRQLDTMGGRNIDNANFFTVENLDRKSDDELYGLLLNEFPSFVKQAKEKGMIK